MKELLFWDQTLFKDSELFELDHIPEHFLHRESQLQSLMHCIRPALGGGRSVNSLCIGAPGTGKTTAIQKVFEEIENILKNWCRCLSIARSIQQDMLFFHRYSKNL